MVGRNPGIIPDVEDWELTVLQFAAKYPKSLTREHYVLVIESMLAGETIPPAVLTQYPSLALALQQYQGKDLTKELNRLLKNATGNKLSPRSKK